MSDQAQLRDRNKADRKGGSPIDPAFAEGAGLLDPVERQDGDTEPTMDPPGRRKGTSASEEAEKRTLLERAEKVFRIFSLAAISISVALAVYQFREGRIDERKERSVGLMSRWQGSEERRAYTRLSQALEIRLEDTGMVLGQVTPGALSQIKYNIGRSLIKDWSIDDGDYQSWSDDIEMIFNFYGEVEFCIRAELCDIELLTAYFGGEAESFWEYFRSYAEDQRASFYPSYGSALESLIRSFEVN